MAYGTVIKMCNKLNLNPVDFSSLERDTTISEQLLENRVMQAYVKLNQEGRDKVMDLMEDFSKVCKSLRVEYHTRTGRQFFKRINNFNRRRTMLRIALAMYDDLTSQ